MATGGSRTPPRTRGRSPTRVRGRDVVIQQVVKETSNTMVYPVLTRTNYPEWSLVMRVNLQAQGLWPAVEDGDVDYREDRQALSAILRAVPPEMLSTLAVKDTAKQAWDAIRTQRMGVDRVREANAQKLRMEFESITFKDGESVDDFSMRITSLVNNMQVLGDTVEEERVVKKVLRAVPPRYTQVAIAIEMLLDLSTLSMDELTGRLRSAEERYGIGELNTKFGAQLLLTEEEWRSRDKNRDHAEGAQLLLTEEEWRARDKNRDHVEGSSISGNPKGFVRGNSRDRPVRRGKCYNCGVPGHFSRECRKPRRQQREEAHLSMLDNDQPALLIAATTSMDGEVVPAAPTNSEYVEYVYLNEERVLPVYVGEGVWYLDTGASNHMSGTREMFTSLDESVKGSVKLGDGSVVEICGRGAVMFLCKTKEHKVLTEVYFMPGLRSNIISIGQLDENGCKTIIENGMLKLFDREKRLLAQAPRAKNRLYTLKLELASPVCLLSKMNDIAWLWHARYGHLNFRSLQRLAQRNMVEGIPSIDKIDQFCNGCALGKQHRTSFPRASAYRASKGLELVHIDLCGPINPATPGGNNYFLLIVDDYSRFMWVEVLKTKDEALKSFKKFKVRAELEIEGKLMAFRSDRGGEFNSNDFREFCDEHGIKHCTTAPYSPQQNGVVERRNQTVVEMARCLLKGMGMPSMFWGEAVNTAVYILNRSSTQSLDEKTPYEVWFNRKPKVQHLRTFGCVAHVKRLGPGVSKMEDRSMPMVFIGYEEGSKAYRFFDPIGKKLHVSRDVAFEEHKRWDWLAEVQNQSDGTFTMEYKSKVEAPGIAQTSTEQFYTGDGVLTPLDTGDGVLTPLASGSDGIKWATPPTNDETLDTGVIQPRYRKVTDVYDNSEEVDTMESGLCFLAAEEPKSVEDALTDNGWKRAMKDELKSIRNNGTWEFATLPAGHKAIGLKWVFKVKKDPLGNVVKHKARLVAKGYVQRQGVDFDEVFAPVARMETIRFLLALAAHNGWEIHHMDVKSAFLNGDLAEDVYVHQPPGFVDSENEHKVLKLHKALYGLRQAPRAWNAKLDSSLISLGFQRSPLEHAVYRRIEGSMIVLVGVYVDDLIITGTRVNDIVMFKGQMENLFDMSDLGLLTYYLGIEVNQGKGEITLCQRAYARKILETSGMMDCNPCHTPMENRLKLSNKDAGEDVGVTRYRSIVGSLRYLCNTRPDIVFSVGLVSRFMEVPKTSHWEAVKRILRYVSGTVGHGLRYKKSDSSPVLLGYSDSDYAGGDDKKSTAGFVFYLGSNLVSWISQKQKVVTLSSCEAEYIACTTAACQGLWLSRLLGNVTNCEPMTVKLLVDNKSAIDLSKNPVHHDRSKHIEIRFHFIRDCVENGSVDVSHVRTTEQLADILTKALARTRFVELRLKIGVVEVGCSKV